jgi:CDP-glycerol glycerophosphotransferase (TagB/SpsB family)
VTVLRFRTQFRTNGEKPAVIRGLVLAVALGLAAGLISVWVQIRRGRLSGIAPASVLQRKYRLYAENRPVIQLDPEQVPVHLRHLIPLAEKWGIGDDIIRNDYIEQASDIEKRELHDAFYEPFEQITEWLGTFEKGSLTEEAEAFMYAQGALDEMGYYILDEKARGRDTPEE